MKKLIILICCVMSLVACNSNSVNKVQQIDASSIEKSLTWAGVYEGILPCADCKGIQTVLTLKQDLSYTLKQFYIQNNKKIKANDDHGSFIFEQQNNDILVNLGNDKKFLIEKDKVTYVDPDTNKPMLEHYTLKQIKAF